MSAAIQRIRVSPAGIAAHAAHAIVERHCAELPDLRGVIVLLPDLHAVGDFARELRHAANVPVLLAPRVTTLRAWASEVALKQSVMGGAAREALLYRALAERSWFDERDLWAVCGELAALFDELTRERIELPASHAEFSARLARAYRKSGASAGAPAGAALDFEARLVHELWLAFSRAGGALDAESAYVARLARIADSVRAPLYVVVPQALSRAESAFLERYAACAPVQMIEAEPDAGDAVSRTLAVAWPPVLEVNLLQRARTINAEYPQSPLTSRVRVAAAAHAEAHAQIIDCAVRERLVAGRRRIAVVVQDRLAARRARALLERAGVVVADEAGWALSTVSAATAIGRWLDVASSGCRHSDLFDLLKSPFVFHDWPRLEREQVVQRFEQRVRAANVGAGFENFIALAERHNDAEARQMLVRLQRAARLLERRRASIAQWLDLLAGSLAEIGVSGEQGALAQDAAGEQLLDLLGRLRDELTGDTLAIPFADWRRWLARAFEAATFRDHSLESPVVFTFLAATPLRRFDAVIIAGADAVHLPGTETAAMFFNQGVRAELGLRTRADAVREMEAALRQLIVSCDDVLVTWQRTRDGEANLLSPFFERLNGLQVLAWGVSLNDDTVAARCARAVVAPPGLAPLSEPTTQPAPCAPPALIPEKISASGYNALMACPYQYHARHVLRLAEIDEVQELIDKADYGSAVHAALTTFHRLHPVVSDLDAAEAAQALETITDSAFREAAAQHSGVSSRHGGRRAGLRAARRSPGARGARPCLASLHRSRRYRLHHVLRDATHHSHQTRCLPPARARHGTRAGRAVRCDAKCPRRCGRAVSSGTLAGCVGAHHWRLPRHRPVGTRAGSARRTLRAPQGSADFRWFD